MPLATGRRNDRGEWRSCASLRQSVCAVERRSSSQSLCSLFTACAAVRCLGADMENNQV